MTEGFEANTAEVAGMGKLADRIATDTMASHPYILEHAGLNDTLPGQILQRLAPFVSEYQEYTRSRHVHLSATCGYIGNELQKTAWLYDDQENENYDALNAHTNLFPPPLRRPGTSETPAVGVIDEYFDVANYGDPDGIDYPAPNPAVDDIREAVDDAASWLGEIDRTIFELSGWSPLNEATIPVTGNWNEIRRLGQAYEIAGNAMEAAAMSLEKGARRVDGSWDGAAAQSFSVYAGRQVAAMYWEGPAGRTIHALTGVIADQIRSAVQSIVRKIVEMLEAEVDIGSGRGAMKVALKKIPVLGTAWQIERIIEICWQAMNLTMDLVAKIETVVDDFGRFLAAITDPEGQINQTIDKHLTPLTDFLEHGMVAVEAGKTADISPLINTPNERFSVGEGTQPWADA